MRSSVLARAVVALVAAFTLVLAGPVAGPASAGDDRGLGTPPSDKQSVEAQALAGDAYIFREHSTANHERVDLFDERIDKVRNDHNVRFDALVRAIEWARSPRKDTSQYGIDRGIYQYKIYEYEDGRKTGRWVIIQSIIEWGDGMPDRGWMVTAYPVRTNNGAPAERNGKSWAPAWLSNSFVFGPINNEILY